MTYPLVAALTRSPFTLAAVALIVGCSTAGSPASAPSLEPGDYPTARIDTPADPDPQLRSTINDGHRLAAHVVVPAEVDPAFEQVIIIKTLTLTSPETVSAILANDAYTDIATKHGFLVGFASTRQSDNHAELLNAVLQFPTPNAATAAAEEMTGTIAAQHITIPRHPAAAGSVDPTTHELRAVTAHGNCVLYQQVTDPAGDAAAAELAAKTLDLQTPRADTAVPADPQVYAFPPDEGLLHFVLPTSPTVNVGLYPAAGALHFLNEPVPTGQALTSGKVNRVAIGKAVVYESADSTAAHTFFGKRAGIINRQARPTDGVTGLPWARCFDRGDRAPMGVDRFRCVADAGRYTFETVSTDRRDAQQQLAAQYILLAG